MAQAAVDPVQIKCPACGFICQRPNRGPLHPFTCSKCNKILIIPGKIGDILVDELLGTGGMGAVYKGTDPLLQRQIAVKLMKKSADGKSQQTNQQYIQEARSQAKVNHAHVAQVFSAGMFNDAPYIVMELIEAGMLSTLFTSEKPMAESQAIQYAIQIAKGLQAAYNAGITHRDIKPSNVLIDKQGNAKIVDFGLAGSVQGEETIGVGTAAYIAPENLRKPSPNQPRPDHRADMYSLGVTLYELITGQQPFTGKDSQEKMSARFKGPPRNICLINDQLHLETSALINRLLKIDPAQRYATYDELIKDLQEVQAAVEAGPANVDIFSIPAEQGGATVDPSSLSMTSSTGLSAGRQAKNKISVEIDKKPLYLIGAGILVIAIIAVVLNMGPGQENTPASKTSVVLAPKPVQAPPPATTATTTAKSDAPKPQTAQVEPAQTPAPPAQAATPTAKVQTPKTQTPQTEPAKAQAPATPTTKTEPAKTEAAQTQAPSTPPTPTDATKTTPPPRIPTPAQLVKVSMIENGKILRRDFIRKTADNWDLINGALVSRDPKDSIVCVLPDWDFKVTMTLILSNEDTSYISINRDGKLGFRSKAAPARIYTTGLYGPANNIKDTVEYPTIPTDELIPYNTKPFDLEIVRIGTTLNAYIIDKTGNRRKVLSGTCAQGKFGYIRIFPGIYPMQIINFAVDSRPSEIK